MKSITRNPSFPVTLSIVVISFSQQLYAVAAHLGLMMVAHTRSFPLASLKFASAADQFQGIPVSHKPYLLFSASSPIWCVYQHYFPVAETTQ